MLSANPRLGPSHWVLRTGAVGRKSRLNQTGSQKWNPCCEARARCFVEKIPCYWNLAFRRKSLMMGRINPKEVGWWRQLWRNSLQISLFSPGDRVRFCCVLSQSCKNFPSDTFALPERGVRQASQRNDVLDLGDLHLRDPVALDRPQRQPLGRRLDHLGDVLLVIVRGPVRTGHEVDLGHHLHQKATHLRSSHAGLSAAASIHRSTWTTSVFHCVSETGEDDLRGTGCAFRPHNYRLRDGAGCAQIMRTSDQVFSFSYRRRFHRRPG